MRSKEISNRALGICFLAMLTLSACASNAATEDAVVATEVGLESEADPVEGGDDTAAESEVVIPYPVTDDAQDLEDFFGLYSYTSAYSVEEIVEFYTQELEALGYVKDSQVAGTSMAVLQFTTDTKIMTINITEDDAGRFSVKLTEGEP